MSGHSVFLMFSRSSIYTETSQQRQLHKLYLRESEHKDFPCDTTPILRKRPMRQLVLSTTSQFAFSRKARIAGKK